MPKKEHIPKKQRIEPEKVLGTKDYWGLSLPEKTPMDMTIVNSTKVEDLYHDINRNKKSDKFALRNYTQDDKNIFDRNFTEYMNFAEGRIKDVEEAQESHTHEIKIDKPELLSLVIESTNSVRDISPIYLSDIPQADMKELYILEMHERCENYFAMHISQNALEPRDVRLWIELFVETIGLVIEDIYVTKTTIAFCFSMNRRRSIKLWITLAPEPKIAHLIELLPALSRVKPSELRNTMEGYIFEYKARVYSRCLCKYKH